MKFFRTKPFIMIGLFSLVLFAVSGCDGLFQAKDKPTAPEVFDLSQTEDPGITAAEIPELQTSEADSSEMPEINVIGANINIAWPFPGENPSEWRFGRGQQRTGGGTIYACGRWMNSHSGADYYARDMSRYDGYSYGKAVRAGISGRVIKSSWCGGYGYCVVIYDSSRRVAIRYAHLIGFGLIPLGRWVSAGQYIGMLGDSGNAGGSPHLHIVAYENVPDNGLNGWLPSCCSSTWYACRINSW